MGCLVEWRGVELASLLLMGVDDNVYYHVQLSSTIKKQFLFNNVNNVKCKHILLTKAHVLANAYNSTNKSWGCTNCLVEVSIIRMDAKMQSARMSFKVRDRRRAL